MLIELPLAVYDLAIKAELLAADEKSGGRDGAGALRRLRFAPGESRPYLRCLKIRRSSSPT